MYLSDPWQIRCENFIGLVNKKTICFLIVVKGLTERVRILIALGELVIGMHPRVDVRKEVRSPLLELLKSMGCSPRAH